MINVPQDIEFMVAFLGRSDPSVRRLLKAYMRDPEIRDTVRAVLKHRCMKKGFDADDPPVFWPVRELPAGTFDLGRVINGSAFGPAFTLPQNVVTQHLGLFGHTPQTAIRTLNYWRDQGELRATKFARRVWYLKDELEKFLEIKTEE